MDINGLFTDAGMRAFTDEQREQHMQDAREYGQLREIIQSRLQETPVDGDKPLSARLRARRVARKVRAMEKASRKAASSAEALYATYVHQVLNLPQRRELAAARKADRKAQRTGAVAQFAAKSLDKSGVHFGGDAASPQVNGPRFLDAEPYQFPMAAGAEHQAVPSIGDLFPKESR